AAAGTAGARRLAGLAALGVDEVVAARRARGDGLRLDPVGAEGGIEARARLGDDALQTNLREAGALAPLRRHLRAAPGCADPHLTSQVGGRAADAQLGRGRR